jgi:hypothetical protein
MASAVNGVFSDGFQMQVFPHTSASAAFQDHTATGKLKEVIIPVGPRGCQVSIIPVAQAFARDGEAVELPGQSNGKVRDVNHLLDLAQSLGQDLAGLEGDETAKIALCSSELLTE